MKALIVILLIISSLTVNAKNTVDDVVYLGQPIKLNISTKEDSFIYFPNPVKVKDDFSHLVDILPTNDVVIIRALTSFESKRFIFKDLKTEQVYIFNITGNESDTIRSVRVLSKENHLEAEKISANKLKGDPYIVLTQYVSMSLYYPERYKPDVRGIKEIEIDRNEVNYFITFNGTATTIKAYKGFGYFITAVYIENKEINKIVLDPRKHFRGDWMFLSYQHSDLEGVTDVKSNMTTVYVISKRPFLESLI